MDTIVGWISDVNGYGFRISGRWVGCAEGSVIRPMPGEYAAVELDSEGHAVHIEVRAWRPLPPNPN